MSFTDDPRAKAWTTLLLTSLTSLIMISFEFAAVIMLKKFSFRFFTMCGVGLLKFRKDIGHKSMTS